MVTITGVNRGTAAARAKLQPQDVLVSINGHEIADVLDYMFYAAEAKLELSLLRDNAPFCVTVKKGEYDDLGLEFASFLMDQKKSCHNRCMFCFIDQMPPGMRETLYFKDDDARLSFLQGNYVTLTNLSQADVDRIIRMRLNINVSVHTTNPALRCEMMHNRFAGDALRYLQQMADGGLMLNCQIVLCPGLNDGDELRRTLRDLCALMPQVTSVAVVPVGLSKFREGLYPLQGFTPEAAAAAIDIIEAAQETMRAQYDTRVIFPADELFLLAGREIPEAAYYEDYPQYENGVGMLRSLMDEFAEALADAEDPGRERVVSLATGAAAYPMILSLTQQVEKRFEQVHCHVYCIRNEFFGTTITVTGLITGQDLSRQLAGKPLGEVLLLSESMVRRDDPVFLDDMTPESLSETLQIPLKFTKNDGFALLDVILGLD